MTHPRDFLPYANQPHCDQCGGFGTAHRSLWQCSIEVVGYTGPKGFGGLTPANYGEIDATLCTDCQEKVTHYRPKYHEDVRVRAVKRVRLIQGKPEEWEAEGKHVVNATPDDDAPWTSRDEGLSLLN